MIRGWEFRLDDGTVIDETTVFTHEILVEATEKGLGLENKLALACLQVVNSGLSCTFSKDGQQVCWFTHEQAKTFVPFERYSSDGGGSSGEMQRIDGPTAWSFQLEDGTVIDETTVFAQEILVEATEANICLTDKMALACLQVAASGRLAVFYEDGQPVCQLTPEQAKTFTPPKQRVDSTGLSDGEPVAMYRIDGHEYIM